MIEYTVKVFPDGGCAWYLDDELHCEHGPAIVGSDGSREWWLKGLLHREDGPAIVNSDGSRFWFLNGALLTESEHREQTWHQPTLNGKTAEIDGKTYVLTLKE